MIAYSEEEQARAERFGIALGTRSLTSVGKAAGVATSTVAGYAKGKLPTADVALRIADFLGVDLRWYISGEQSADYAPDATSLRLLNGSGHVVGVRHFANDVLNGVCSAPSQAFCLEVTGAAMAPTVCSASEVVVDPGEVEDGHLCVLSVSGRYLVRRIQRLHGGKVRTIHDNSTFIDDVTEVGDVAIVGRVVLIVSRPQA
ncbi:hypothetical protein GCM10007301_22850 [Azorhizobium oxalatiphilum]|uniref:HTH cro/C1-type domain-containing protein n=1 Tax=Azorhizobium oxalatiphilum TaxID=980631 RepID=A0A917FBM5_9HYPH|nr:XRE family transcriptional regulator [Azorhizobium oxalatiphilum]GGF62552.1 hypothetical protein GCM10007301_22850 [Azorhizobium oxalatiphilum]